jgi:hypothetical protein
MIPLQFALYARGLVLRYHKSPEPTFPHRIGNQINKAEVMIGINDKWKKASQKAAVFSV